MSVRTGLLVGLMLALGACGGDSGQRETSPRTAAQYNAELGIAYLQKNNVSEARGKIERALKQDPNNPVVQTAAALLYDRMGETDRADRHYSTVVRLKPKDPEALNNYAIFLCRNQRAAAGERMFLEAAASPLNRQPEMAYTNAAVCARNNARPDEAQRYFEQALSVKAGHREAMEQLAALHLTRGKPEQARNYVLRLLAGDPVSAEALWLAVRVERALGNHTAADSYAKRLKADYPSTEQARALIASERKSQ
ncbi:MAG: type IV pilus biogenesis/stability protein PilW [Gammaproteobacteria bacterium]|nr:type IV pilus biogenesis/stability protein PilW [Gammaproteobacteria bacterium]